MLRWLRAEIKKITDKIGLMIEKREDLSKRAEQLQSAKGVGLITANFLCVLLDFF
jgi:hypothetical protein